jgi:hypothetical protein
MSGFHQRQKSLSQTLSRWEEFLRTDVAHLNAFLTSAGAPLGKVE